MSAITKHEFPIIHSLKDSLKRKELDTLRMLNLDWPDALVTIERMLGLLDVEDRKPAVMRAIEAYEANRHVRSDQVRLLRVLESVAGPSFLETSEASKLIDPRVMQIVAEAKASEQRLN